MGRGLATDRPQGQSGIAPAGAGAGLTSAKNDADIIFMGHVIEPRHHDAESASPRYRFAEALADAAADGAKSERTRARLQAACCDLLEQAGPSTLIVADICRRAQVAHGTFYLYFRDTRHILHETLTGFVAFLKSTMRKAARAGDGDRIVQTTAAYVALFERNRGLMRCLVSRLEDFPEATAAFEALNRDWATIVAAAIARRAAREGRDDLPPREELLRRAYALGGMVDQYLVALFFGQDAMLASLSRDRDALVRTLSHIWTRGMAP
jgi:AcrR family transcriptional regulator